MRFFFAAMLIVACCLDTRLLAQVALPENPGEELMEGIRLVERDVSDGFGNEVRRQFLGFLEGSLSQLFNSGVIDPTKKLSRKGSDESTFQEIYLAVLKKHLLEHRDEWKLEKSQIVFRAMTNEWPGPNLDAAMQWQADTRQRLRRSAVDEASGRGSEPVPPGR